MTPASSRLVVAPDVVYTAARLRLLFGRFARLLRQQGQSVISPSMESTLFTIERLGSPTLGELAVSEHVTPPSMTKIVTTLEQVGAVEREADPNDGRVTRVHVLPQGQRILRANNELRNAFMARRLEQLSAEDHAAIAYVADLLDGVLEDDVNPHG
jgi:DNA-binding MarR family transcriptional regulator